MVGNAPLGVVVGADPLRSVPASDEEPPLLGPFRRLPVALRREQPGAEQGQGRARGFLCCDRSSWHSHHQPGREVGDANGRVGLVEVLAARSRRPERVDLEIAGINLDLAHVLDLGQDRDGARGCVDPALRLGLRHPLHPDARPTRT